MVNRPSRWPSRPRCPPRRPASTTPARTCQSPRGLRRRPPPRCGLGLVVRQVDVDVDAIALRARRVHLLEPERRPAPWRVDLRPRHPLLRIRARRARTAGPRRARSRRWPPGHAARGWVRLGIQLPRGRRDLPGQLDIALAELLPRPGNSRTVTPSDRRSISGWWCAATASLPIRPPARHPLRTIRCESARTPTRHQRWAASRQCPRRTGIAAR